MELTAKFFTPHMNEVLEFVVANENGVTEEMLSRQFHTIPKNEIAIILNNLLHQKKLEVQRIGTGLVYKAIPNRSTSYEALILNLIAQSGTSGLWLKDIKSKTNIPHNLVLKLLRVMEESRKIKSVKSVKNNRKTYVLYDVKPDEDVSGGVWFSNNDVDLVFVSKLMDVIYGYIKRPEGTEVEDLVTLRGVKDFIAASGVSEVELTIEDIGTLVDCLVYDGRIEKIEGGGGIHLRALSEDFMRL